MTNWNSKLVRKIKKSKALHFDKRGEKQEFNEEKPKWDY